MNRTGIARALRRQWPLTAFLLVRGRLVLVGDTGFEPVTSSVSSIPGPSVDVRERRSEHEPLPQRPSVFARTRPRCQAVSQAGVAWLVFRQCGHATPLHSGSHSVAPRLPNRRRLNCHTDRRPVAIASATRPRHYRSALKSEECPCLEIGVDDLGRGGRCVVS